MLIYPKKHEIGRIKSKSEKSYPILTIPTSSRSYHVGCGWSEIKDSIKSNKHVIRLLVDQTAEIYFPAFDNPCYTVWILVYDSPMRIHNELEVQALNLDSRILESNCWTLAIDRLHRRLHHVTRLLSSWSRAFTAIYDDPPRSPESGLIHFKHSFNVEEHLGACQRNYFVRE